MTKKSEIEKELRSLAKRLDLKDLSETFYFPKYFEIETIRACNARCKMCPVWQNPKDYGKMEQKLFVHLFQQLICSTPEIQYRNKFEYLFFLYLYRKPLICSRALPPTIFFH